MESAFTLKQAFHQFWTQTHLLILDEPSGLVLSENIVQMVARLNERAANGSDIVLIERNARFWNRVAGVRLKLEAGRGSFVTGCGPGLF